MLSIKDNFELSPFKVIGKITAREHGKLFNFVGSILQGTTRKVQRKRNLSCIIPSVQLLLYR